MESQGEVGGHEGERVYFGTDVLGEDTASPVVRAATTRRMVVARIHDNLTPHVVAGWKSITAAWKVGRRPMRWYGENLYFVGVPRGARGRRRNKTRARAGRHRGPGIKPAAGHDRTLSGWTKWPDPALADIGGVAHPGPAAGLGELP